MTAAAAQTRPPDLCSTSSWTGAAVHYSITGDLRFLSHHDELRMLTRALVRAGWPLWYSQGFNPQPRIVLPLPRSVGIASDCQWAMVRLTEAPRVAELGRALQTQMPRDCVLLAVYPLEARLSPQPQAVFYSIGLQSAAAQAIGPRIAALQAEHDHLIERNYGPQRPSRSIDIRPFVQRVELRGRTLELELSFTEGRSARPEEILAALGLKTADLDGPIVRRAIHWNIEPPTAGGWSADAEREQVGCQEEDCSQEEGQGDRR